VKRLVWLCAWLAACSCPGKATVPTGTTTAATGSGSSAPAVATCDGARAKLDALYRAEAQIKEPKRVDAAVADNVAMALADCAKDPARIAPCLATADSVATIEKQCLIALDEEGTEGEGRAR
jgi:hypothetical protein